jgi:hypothetical protein
MTFEGMIPRTQEAAVLIAILEELKAIRALLVLVASQEDSPRCTRDEA